jgi:hypothetical protein
MQEAEDSWAWDAHAETAGSTTELSVTEYYRGRGGDVKIYREVSEAICPITDLGHYQIRTRPRGVKRTQYRLFERFRKQPEPEKRFPKFIRYVHSPLWCFV